MDAQRTRKVINRIIAENYPIESRPTRKPSTKLRSFRDVTGGLSKRTNVIISPKKRDTENNVNVNELSQQALRGYVKNASKDISQRKDDYVKDIIQSKREPKFKDVFRKIGNRAVGIQKASRRMTMPKEEAPTNSMGLSSSTHGTGNIDTYDPLLGKKRKRKKPTARRNP